MNPTIQLIATQMIMVCVLLFINIAFSGYSYTLRWSQFIQYTCAGTVFLWTGYLGLLVYRLLKHI